MGEKRERYMEIPAEKPLIVIPSQLTEADYVKANQLYLRRKSAQALFRVSNVILIVCFAVTLGCLLIVEMAGAGAASAPLLVLVAAFVAIVLFWQFFQRLAVVVSAKRAYRGSALLREKRVFRFYDSHIEGESALGSVSIGWNQVEGAGEGEDLFLLYFANQFLVIAAHDLDASATLYLRGLFVAKLGRRFLQCRPIRPCGPAPLGGGETPGIELPPEKQETLFSLSFHYRDRDLFGRTLLPTAMVLLSASLVAAAVIVLLWAPGTVFHWGRFAGLTLGIFALAMLVLLLFLRRGRRNDPDLSAEQWIGLSDKGLDRSGGVSNGLIPWGMIDCVRETRGAFHIRYDKNYWMIIPKRALENEDPQEDEIQVTLFRSRLHDYLPPARFR